MRGRSEKRSWLRCFLFLINLGVVVAVLRWNRRAEHWWGGMVFFAWLWFSAGFFRWFDRRRRRADRSTPRPPVVETPAALQAPPPRAVRSEFAARAVRRHRTAYPPLLLLPALLGVAWFRRAGASVDLGRAAIQGVVLCALVMAAVAYVESKVRAVRRLVREGSVVQGVVEDVSPLRKLPVRWRSAPRIDIAGRGW